MEKDLRDAYKALSLLRADLVATRKAKGDLEDQWRAFIAQQRAQDKQRGAQLAQIRETFLMREEDFNAQLLHAAATHNEQQQQALVKNALLMQELAESREKTAKMPKNASENGENGRPQPEEEDNQKHHESQATLKETKERVEAFVAEKLELVASVFALKQQVQTQADQLIQQDVAITQERSEWTLQREELKREIADLHESKRDFEREKKFSEEKFEFLRTEVDVVKAERDASKHQVQTLEEKVVEDMNSGVPCEETAVEEREMTAKVGEEMKEIHANQVAELMESHAEELEEYKRRVEELECEIEELKTAGAFSQEALNAIHAETVEKLKTQFAEENVKLQEEIKTMMEERSQLEETTTALQEELQKVEERKTHEIEELKTPGAFSQEELNAIHAETVEKLKTQFAEENQKLHDEIEAVKEERKSLEERVTALQEELQKAEETKTEEMQRLMKEREELMQQLENVRAEAQEQVRSHAKAEESRMKTQLSEREKLQQELTTLLTSFEDATAENAVKMESLQTTNNALQRTLSEKSRAMAETQGRVKSAQQQLSRMENVVAFQREGLAKCREEAREQKRLVIEQQQQLKVSIQQLEEELLARFNIEKDTIEQQSRREKTALEQQLVSCKVARTEIEEELRASADMAQALKQQLHRAEAARAFLQQEIETSGARIAELEGEVGAKDEELDSLRSQTENEHEARRQEVVTLRTLHHKVTAERNAMAEELSKLKMEYGRLESEVADGRTTSVQLRKLQDQQERLESQTRGLEQQLMAAEDQAEDPQHRGDDGITSNTSSWSDLSTQIRSLDDFLPQLQLFTGRLQTCFLLCAENPRAMRVLSTMSMPSLLSDLMTLRQLVDGWRQLFEVKGLALHVRMIRRSVLATLALWFEEGEENSDASSPPPPPPPFGMDSQEVAIILQNWTQDLDKRQSVSDWLKRIATATKSVSGDSDSSPQDDDAGTTLELKDMTREAKDAFCMLIVPLLKQNRHIFVRVFTRRVCDIKSSYSPDETSWQMRIVVQFPQQPRRMELPGQLRRVSSSSSISSVASSMSVSSAASSLSLSSISSASKLQMIQARLQQMQQQNHY